MSDPAQEHLDFARAIYLAFVQDAGPTEWDWQKVANVAFDAAERFAIVAAQRVNPQTAVPVDQPAAPASTQDPTATGTVAPTS